MYNIGTEKVVKDNKIIINDHVFMVSDEIAKAIHQLCIKGVINTEKSVKVTEKKPEKKTVKVSEKKSNYSSSKNGRIECKRFSSDFTFNYSKKGNGYVVDLPFRVNRTLWNYIGTRFREAGFQFDEYTNSYVGGDIKKLRNTITASEWDAHCTKLEKWWNREK